MIKISVIIPVFNVAEYLHDCLDSVICQTIFTDVEVIIIDDCSEDNSRCIAKAFATKYDNVSLYSNYRNLGLAITRNIGIDKATGVYVFFLDSDDKLAAQNSLEELYRIAEEDGVDEVIGSTLRWVERDGTRSPGYHGRYLLENLRCISLVDFPVIRDNVIACNKLIRLNLIKDNNIYFNNKSKKHEDLAFSWKVHAISKSISVCVLPSYLHRIRNKSKSLSLMQSYKDDYIFRSIAAIDIIDFFGKNRSDFWRALQPEKRIVRWFLADARRICGDKYSLDEGARLLKCYYPVMCRLSYLEKVAVLSRERLLIHAFFLLTSSNLCVFIKCFNRSNRFHQLLCLLFFIIRNHQ